MKRRRRKTRARAAARAIRRNATRLDVRWTRWVPARMAREAILNFVLGPLMDYYVRRRVRGRELFRDLKGPVVLVANHSSHLDTPAILRALPRKWRRRTAVAAAADYFYRNRLKAAFVALVFCTVPIQRRGGGKAAMAHLDRLLEQRWNLLVYPEGTRSRDGSVGRLRAGAAFLAAEHGLRIVPIQVRGTREAMPPGRSWPHRLRGRFFSRRHRVDISFGEPIDPATYEDRSAVMAQVRAFLEEDEPGAPRGLPQPAETRTLSPSL